jgi:DNA-binding transcriptional LysR family regulator
VHQLHDRLRFAQAGVGVAVVDQVAIAGELLAGLEARPFQSSEKLPVRIIRNRYRRMSVVEKAFVEEFSMIWTQITEAIPSRQLANSKH